ncbi:MAG: hypothetical protein IKN11_05390, partial [Bacteroidales bacterium]|nr:hypothetical protein [Bacteroidales bacterium]
MKKVLFLAVSIFTFHLSISNFPMKKYILLSILLAASLPAFSQHFDWVKSYSGYSRSDYPYNHIVGSVTDSHGNLYVAGQFGNGSTIDGQDLLPITPHGPQCDNINGAIVKFSPDGQIIWKKVLHANQGFPCTIDEIHLVGDTALYVESFVHVPGGVDGYMYFFDTLITKDNSSFMMSLDSSASGSAAAFSIMDLDGNFLEHHFLQIAWIDSNGAVITMDRSGGINPESTRRIDNQPFPGGPFCVDSDGNIYIGQVPTDIIALLDGWYSIENGKLSGVLIMVNGHSRFTFYPENRPSVSNYRILKFSPHFDSLIQYQYVFADTSFWDNDVPTEGRLLMDSENNIYLCQTVYNDIRRGSGRVSLNGASDMAFEGKEATMGFMIKYNSHLEPQYIRQIDYQNTSNDGYYNYYFHDMAIDEDSNSLFVIATVANDVPTDSMFVEGVQLDANNNALFLRFDKSTGRYLSHGIVPTNKYSNFYGTIHNTDVVCKNNRVFALPTFQNNIQWQNNEINIEQYKWGKGLFIWDYAGDPIQYIDFNSISSQSEPGNALVLHDSILYVCGYSRFSMTVDDTTLNPSGNTLAYIAKYVDTSFMTPYVHTGPQDTGDVRIKVVEDGNTFVAYPNPFRQRV